MKSKKKVAKEAVKAAIKEIKETVKEAKETAKEAKGEVNELKEQAKIKKMKVFELKVTKLELIHLRDMMSVLFSSPTEKTISQVLAESEDRAFEENSLWKKIAAACLEANLPINDEAPDYAVMPIGPAPMGIFMLGQEDAPQVAHSFLKTAEAKEQQEEEEEV